MKQVFGKSRLENQNDQSNQKAFIQSASKLNLTSGYKSQNQSYQMNNSQIKYNPTIILEENHFQSGENDYNQANRQNYRPMDPMFQQLYENTLNFLNAPMSDVLPISAEDTCIRTIQKLQKNEERLKTFADIDKMLDEIMQEEPLDLRIPSDTDEEYDQNLTIDKKQFILPNCLK